MNLLPSQMTLFQLSFLVLRDILILLLHSFLLYTALNYDLNDKICIQESTVLPWLIFDILITTCRLIKNPLQYLANTLVHANGSGWHNPNDLAAWVRGCRNPRYFRQLNQKVRQDLSRMVCQMRIYTFIDWLSYLTWIVGGIVCVMSRYGVYLILR